MAAPEHVPTKPAESVRAYTSPPRRSGAWRTDRPGDFASAGRQPSGDQLGSQGPDQGYALKLAKIIEGQLQLRSGEHRSDAVAGVVAVGLKRASAFGRAPVIHDLRVGATLFGFLDSTPDESLVRFRTSLFEEVGHFHHYTELRHIADLVADDVLRQTPEQVEARYEANWRDQLLLENDI